MSAVGTQRAAVWRRDFGYRLRQLRELEGLSQAELAARAGLHVTYVSSIETGRRNLSLVNIHALAEALLKTPAVFFEDEQARMDDPSVTPMP
jgi:transcriptional regulator with XRE-family HTH domain